MHAVAAVMRLSRLDSSLLASLAVFVPLAARTHDFWLSAGRALPLLLICMCTFIANDLDDLERDRLNHPDRPLPSGSLTPRAAAAWYFVFLGSALFLTRYTVDERTAFWYYALLSMCISYTYVLEWLPGIKPLYVAAAITVPIVIVAVMYPREQELLVVASALFLFALGRELCMDVLDRKGDVASILHHIPAHRIAIVAYALQVVGLIVLASQYSSAATALAAMATLTLQVASAIYWFRRAMGRRAVMVMKIQFFVGLIFIL